MTACLEGIPALRCYQLMSLTLFVPDHIRTQLSPQISLMLAEMPRAIQVRRLQPATLRQIHEQRAVLQGMVEPAAAAGQVKVRAVAHYQGSAAATAQKGLMVVLNA